ncbi:MAG: AmmeMemoRadiSam system radical SAM enzyme [Candidatus Omnitrophica bacterium]|nr:AmmeMemoRadiSam system radical SAM enzyme [Candidatus Omnitrophota bacterium]
MPQTLTLQQLLAGHTHEGALYEKLPNKELRCFACGHRCLIREGRDGICRVRFNRDGILYVPTGYVGALQCDPIEKKPFFHAFPGRDALSFGMLGCDYHCPYCQNFLTSQVLRDPDVISHPMPTRPKELVSLAKKYHAPVIASTYNEPLITSEWAVEVFQVAKQENLKCAYISNGNGTPEVLSYIRPWVDLYKVDLKGFDDKQYRQLGGVLKTVLETIERLKSMGFWVEIVTLTIPGFNDSDEELAQIAKFLVSVSPEIPWHVTAFHKDYKMQEPDNTNAKTLLRAAQIGEAAGLKFIYAGNLPGQVGKYENTYCPGCKTLLIERHGYTILKDLLTPTGVCPTCKRTIPGVWN